MRKNNRRTLAKRIKQTTMLCILLAICVFSATISYLSIHLTKQNGSFFAGVIAYVVADQLSSPEFMQYAQVTKIGQINPGTYQSYAVYKKIRDLESSTYSYYLANAGRGVVVTVPAIPGVSGFIPADASGKKNARLLGNVSFNDTTQIRVLVNDRAIYTSNFWDRATPEFAKIFDANNLSATERDLIDFFTTQASYFISGPDGKPVAEVQVRLSSIFSLNFYLTLVIGILSAALASAAASFIVTSLFVKNVAKPFVVLEKNLNYLAEGNYDELLNSHIQVKKPLHEIQSIADSTNVILDKMHEFNNIIGSQNELLENQNAELETQNEELTESKRQIRDAQTHLVQNQNMASVGQLTAAISHEINTPLGTINSNVQLQNMILDMMLAKPELAGDGEIATILRTMRDSGGKSASSCSQVSLIIKSLKNFSRLDQADFQEADINENAKSVVLLTRYLWKEKISVREEYGSLPYVKCYPGLLNQVFMNIMVNAIHSIQGSGEIVIMTWADSEFVFASIRDNGVGMSKETLADLFEADYVLNSNNSGLGLSICKSVMDKHNGKIDVRSEQGKGTQITICIPLEVKREAAVVSNTNA